MLRKRCGFGNTTDSTVTAIDAKTGAVKGRLVLDNRQRSETVRPLAPRELAVKAKNQHGLYHRVG